MILIKLGGSVITNKKKPLSIRKNAINKIANSLKKINESMIIVHGGGSFGHYWSVKYDMHTKPAKYSVKGISTVKNSMVELNKIILDILFKNALNPYCIPPAGFMSGNKHITNKIKELDKISRYGLTPVTYGDALWHGGNKSYILSGDRIMTIVANILKPRLCIFVMNVDGVYSDIKSRDLIHEIGKKQASISRSDMDVTGGMRRKMQEATKISSKGMNVFFVNGNNPERILKAVKESKFYGTVFRGTKNG